MSKKFNKNKWIAEVREAIQQADKVFSDLIPAFEELCEWDENSTDSFFDIEHTLRLAFDEIDKTKRNLEYLIHRKGWPFIEECRDIQNCLDMEEIGRIAGFPNDNPPYTIGELREN